MVLAVSVVVSGGGAAGGLSGFGGMGNAGDQRERLRQGQSYPHPRCVQCFLDGYQHQDARRKYVELQHRKRFAYPEYRHDHRCDQRHSGLHVDLTGRGRS